MVAWGFLTHDVTKPIKRHRRREFYKIWFINYDTDHIRPCCIHHSHWDKLPYSVNNEFFFVWCYHFSLQYFIYLFLYHFHPTPHHFLIFFYYLLNSESGGAHFLGPEEIMHYTGLVSQSFIKKLLKMLLFFN